MKNKVLALLLLLFLHPLAYADEPRVEVFSPQGTVKKVRQVQVRFSEPMVPLGDPRGMIDPFDVDCPEKGAGLWADGKNWVFDFEKDLPGGVRCVFKLKPGLKALSGREIAGQQFFSFSTGGPAILNATPPEGAGYIDEEQIFLLTLDAEPEPDSVLRNAGFSIEGLQDRVGVRIVEGQERARILLARYGQKPPVQRLLLLQSKQRFPAGTRVALVWGRGVAATSGVATETDQVLRFRTRKAFTAEFRCQRENPRAGCIPLTPMRLLFSAPVSREQAARISLKGPGERTWPPRMPPKKEGKFVQGVFFEGPFPEKAEFSLAIPAGLKDDAGRPLINEDQFPLTVRTHSYPPLAKFSARFGILEWKADPALPVTLRNLEADMKGRVLKAGGQELSGNVAGKIINLQAQAGGEVQGWLRRVASASRETSLLRSEQGAKEFQLPRPQGEHTLQVVGIPFKDPGLYVVELESSLLGQALLDKPRPIYVPAAVLVTNLAVHFKWGRESSLVWVTALDTGEPVPGAGVIVRDCREKVLWQGVTDGEGLARIGQALPAHQELPQCEYAPDSLDAPQGRALARLRGGLFVTAQTPEDFSFVHSSWDEGIEPWRFQLPVEYRPTPLIAHTIFDRTLLRAGETVHMKHILRRHTTRGFSPAPPSTLPQFLAIEHLGSEQKYELPLHWDAKGIAETSWTIPREARLGSYRVSLVKKSPAAQEKRGRHEEILSLSSGHFRVEEFRVPLLRATIQPPAMALISPREVPLELNVQYLAGGGASGLAVKLRSELRPRYLSAFPDFEGFLFGNGPVQEGVERRGAAMEGEGEEAPVDAVKVRKLPLQDLFLDRSGSARASLENLPAVDLPKEILAELEFKDPNGEVQTVSSRVPLWPSETLIGLKPDSWAVSRETLKFHVAVTDLSGRPVLGARVKTDLFARRTFTHRKRLVGGFYAYEHVTETKRIGPLCAGTTDKRGLLICEGRSPVSGSVIIQAETLDAQGRRSFTQGEVWVAEKGEWWFEAGDHDRIDLLPEKKRYEPGETAVFQVRMPFREATALITVEREGILEAWVRKIFATQPVVEVPLKGTYAPNIFVSVLPVRGRAADARIAATVDLGKPAYKLGVSEIKVGWREHELKVRVSSERGVYQVRQKARIRIQVTNAEGKAPPPGSEVALAAVDEGLLELMPNRSWEILPAMMRTRGYAVHTSTAQSQVVGKRHFGLKALPQGGGGGRQMTRELFDTLLLWHGRMPLDENGEAAVEIPLNDSVTSFRIAAMATAGQSLFGTGFMTIQSTQDLAIYSGLPPLIRAGDRFQAEFTLRNTTRREMEVEVYATASGLARPLPGRALSLASGEAREVHWEVQGPAGAEALRWELTAKEKGSPEGDRIKVVQRVIPAVPVRTFQATIARLEKDLRIPVERPAQALAERGGVRVTLRPKIGAGLEGVIDYMRAYSYGCFEQKISRAVALRDPSLWKELMGRLPAHLDADGLVKYFPRLRRGSEILTSYILSVAHEAGWSIPAEAQRKMESGLKRFVEGSLVRGSPLRTADLALRKLSALEALARAGKFEARMLGSISIEPNLWPTSAVIDWLSILQHGKEIPRTEEQRREAESVLRARMTFRGTSLSFSSEEKDRLWWLMASPDTNAVRALLVLLKEETWREEMPRLAIGALARQKRGAWDLTLANAWGVLAMEKFSRFFEDVPVSGGAQAALGTRSRVLDWAAAPQGKMLSFPWPAHRQEVHLAHRGQGKPWATVQALAAIPLQAPLFSGYKVHKTITPVQERGPGRFSRGDVFRVRLEMEAQADQTWVVVNDPVPAGSTILGSGLGRDSELLTQGEDMESRVWPAYEERSQEAFRAYYEFVPKGKWSVEYTLRLNGSGIFQVPPTRVEALYSPEIFGEIPNRSIEVVP